MKDYRICQKHYIHWEVVKRHGCIKKWRDWDTFNAWAQSGYTQGAILCRKDADKPHSPRNSYWGDKTTAVIGDKPYSNNTSGRRGVSIRPQGRYQARITLHGKIISLGYYNTFDAAVKAREAGERKYFDPLKK